jgi:hypothetical protein
VLSGSALWLCAPTGRPRCDATPISRRDIEPPRMKAIPCRRSVTAEGAFQMLFVANAGRPASLAGSPLFMSEADGETGLTR